jgi:membrane protease YdiL (CAAX protease family)
MNVTTRPELQRTRNGAIAAALWLAGFVILRRANTFLPLTVGAVSLAAVFLARDPALRATLTPSPRAILFGGAIGVAMIAATYPIYTAAATAWPALTQQTAALYALLGPDRYSPAIAAALLSVTAASEEVIFRGRLLPAGGASWLRCLIPTLVYALAHATSGSWLLIAVAFVCGFFWAAVRVLTGSLLAPVVVHVAWDLCILLLCPLSRGPSSV